MKYYVWIFLLISGCSTGNLRPIEPKDMVSMYPERHKEHVANVGDTMVYLKGYHSYPGMKLKNDVVAGGGMQIVCNVPKQNMSAILEDDVWIYYRATNVTDYDFLIGSDHVYGGLKLRKVRSDKPRIKNEAVFCRHNTVTLPITSDLNYDLYDFRAKNPHGIYKEVVFRGQSDGRLFFSYLSKDHEGAVERSNLVVEKDAERVVRIGGAEILIKSVGDMFIVYEIAKGFYEEGLFVAP